MEDRGFSGECHGFVVQHKDGVWIKIWLLLARSLLATWAMCYNFFRTQFLYSEVCISFLRLPSILSSEITSSSWSRISNEVLLSLITKSSTQVVLWSKTFSLFSNGKAVDLLQGSRLISMPAHLIGRIFCSTRLFPSYTRQKNKRRWRTESRAEQTWVNTYIFLSLEWILIWDLLNLLAEPQCSCDSWCHPRICLSDILRWL